MAELRVKDMDKGLLTPAVSTTPNPNRSNVRESRAPVPGAQQSSIAHNPDGTPITPVTPTTSTSTTSTTQPANTTTTPVTPTVTQGGGDNRGALQIITDALDAAGLGALASNAWTMWNKGYNINAIMNDPNQGIRASSVYKQRFPAMAALNAAGHGISETEYIAKEEADRGLLYQYLGAAAKPFDTTDQLGKFISGFKSTAELQSDLQAAHDVVNASPETAAWLKANYNLSQNDLAAYWLNPDVSGTDIDRRAKAGQLGGISTQANAGPLSAAQAEALANQGVTDTQARSVFGQIGQDTQFKQNLPGDTSGSVTQQQLLDASFNNNADAINALNRVRGARVADFQDGGNFATDSKGVAGLGNAATL